MIVLIAKNVENQLSPAPSKRQDKWPDYRECTVLVGVIEIFSKQSVKNYRH